MTDTIDSNSRPRPGGEARLGQSTVARMGYGCLGLDRADHDAATQLLRDAVELGVDHLDTAQFYAAGRVNERIRAALQPVGEAVVVASKVGATSAPSAPHGLRPAQTPGEIRAEVEANLRSLGVERLDVVNLFPMSRSAEIPVEGAQSVALEDQLAELMSLRDAGLVRDIGLSHVDVATVRAAAPAGIVCVQNAYSLADRSAEDVFDVCRELGIAWVPYSPLGPSVDGRPEVLGLPSVRQVAARLDASPAQVGLAWLLATSQHCLAIPGAGTREHLEENVASGDLKLDEATRTQLAS